MLPSRVQGTRAPWWRRKNKHCHCQVGKCFAKSVLVNELMNACVMLVCTTWIGPLLGVLFFLIFWWAHKIKVLITDFRCSLNRRDPNGRLQTWRFCLCLSVFVCDWIVTWLLALCGRDRVESIASLCPAAGAGWKQLVCLLPHRECIWGCLLFAYGVFWCLWKVKSLSLFQKKKSWMRWGMLSDIVTRFWVWNVCCLKAVEMVNVHVIIITACVLIFFKRTLSDVVFVYKHILS